MIFQIHKHHGWHMCNNNLEAEANIKAGWVTVTEKEFYDRPKKVSMEKAIPTAPVEEFISNDIADQYEAKFGKRPHHRMNIDTIEAALRADSE